MYYIVCAFQAEARPLVEHFGLKREKILPWPLYRGSGICLIVCGMGKDSAIAATAALLSRFPPVQTDMLFNVGICAAPSHVPIGTLIQASALHTPKRPIPLATFPDVRAIPLQSAEGICNEPCDHAVDMEAFGIYTAARKFLPKARIRFLKIVSDHFDPGSVDVRNVSELIERYVEVFETLFVEHY